MESTLGPDSLSSTTVEDKNVEKVNNQLKIPLRLSFFHYIQQRNATKKMFDMNEPCVLLVHCEKM